MTEKTQRQLLEKEIPHFVVQNLLDLEGVGKIDLIVSGLVCFPNAHFEAFSRKTNQVRKCASLLSALDFLGIPQR